MEDTHTHTHTRKREGQNVKYSRQVLRIVGKGTQLQWGESMEAALGEEPLDLGLHGSVHGQISHGKHVETLT